MRGGESPALDPALGPGGRRFHAGRPPREATGWATTALIVALLAIFSSWATLQGVVAALTALGVGSIYADALLVLIGIAVCALLLPAARSLKASREGAAALAAGDVAAARVATAASRELAWFTFGFAGALVLVLLIVQFLIANDLAVSRTFFLLPLIASSFGLILRAFWTNVYIFCVAQVLVLVWGLVIAVARLAPGAAGKPIRLIATVYTDIFRGLPAIINIYLIGFGLPLTGLPVVRDLAPETFAILALTLTYGAYVAEVYRSGIESIHWSQTAAARSLGLSYLQTLRFVIVPQAVRRIIPPLLNDFISLQKDTALVGVLGAIEANNAAEIYGSTVFNYSSFTVAAILFLLLTIPLARFTDHLIDRDRRRRLAGGPT
jgi:polar amino acid transport system permease protein